MAGGCRWPSEEEIEERDRERIGGRPKTRKERKREKISMGNILGFGRFI